MYMYKKGSFTVHAYCNFVYMCMYHALLVYKHYELIFGENKQYRQTKPII